MSSGGKREGAGRPKGAVSQLTKDIRSAAEKHGPAALQALVDIARTGESEAARVSAATAILDRAYGKPKQGHEVTGKDGKDLVPAVDARDRAKALAAVLLPLIKPV